MEEARSKGIVLYVFPPHTTHLLQPLDVGVYGPLKQVWSQVLKEFKLETIAAFPSLIAKMWDRVVQLEHLIGGFRAAGLHPLSRDAIPPTKLKTSALFQNVASECVLLSYSAASSIPFTASGTSCFSNAGVYPHCTVLWQPVSVQER